MLMNFLQGAAATHADELGAGRTYCEAHNIAWVVTHYMIDIIELPKFKDMVVLKTWPSMHNGLRSYRDFEIRNKEDGRLMIRATSQWVLINLNTRRLLRLNEELPDWGSIDERVWDTAFNKAPKFDATKTHVVKCRFDDVDVNQHINNAVYAVWATETVGFEFRNTHRLSGVEIYFEHEISADTPEVQIQVKLEPTVSYHKIMTGDTQHATVVCHWRPND
jgi:medium-chain acyl-[acyl-carrier-protein] hydrolase